MADPLLLLMNALRNAVRPLILMYFLPVKKSCLGNRLQKGEKCPINEEPIETFQST